MSSTDPTRRAPGPWWLGDAGQTALAAGLALVLLPISWTSVRDGEVSSAWTGLLLAAAIVLHGMVLAARRWPVPAYAVGACSMLVLVSGPDLSGPTADAAGSDYGPVLLPSSLCFFALLYSVSARTRRPWPNAALAAGLVGCLLATARLWEFTAEPLEGWPWRLLLAVATVGATLAAWALGRFQAIRSAWVDQLARRGAAAERRRIAREMHDVVAHSLAVVVSHAEAGRLVVASQPQRAPEILDRIADTGRSALTEMRGLLGVLRDDPGDTDPSGPSGSSPQPTLADLPALVDRVRAAGLQVEYAADDLPRSASPTAELTAYRLVQEALTNVARHATAGAAARLTVTGDEVGLILEVCDDGDPVEPTSPGRGLTGMRERVEAVGGELSSGPNATGWRVWARLPW